MVGFCDEKRLAKEEASYLDEAREQEVRIAKFIDDDKRDEYDVKQQVSLSPLPSPPFSSFSFVFFGFSVPLCFSLKEPTASLGDVERGKQGKGNTTLVLTPNLSCLARVMDHSERFSKTRSK